MGFAAFVFAWPTWRLRGQYVYVFSHNRDKKQAFI